jgi:hypothetical protein
MIVVPDFLQTFLDSIVYESTVLNFSVGTGTTVLTLDNSYHCRSKLMVSIDGVYYQITAFNSLNNTITVGAELVDPKTVIVPNPFFFYGTPMMTNNDLSKIFEASDKFPMIYLYEATTQNGNIDSRNPIEAEVEVRLFFLDNSDFANWDTKLHYQNVIRGLTKTVNKFLGELKTYKGFEDQENVGYKAITHNNFGVFKDLKGHTTRIFNENTSGIELQTRLKIKKCKC